jgi:hypothetical protein
MNGSNRPGWSDFKKGFFLGAGVLTAIVAVGFVTGALRRA